MKLLKILTQMDDRLVKWAAYVVLGFLVGTCGYFLKEVVVEVKEQGRMQEQSNKLLYEAVTTQRYMIQQVNRNTDDIRDMQRRGGPWSGQ